MAEIFNGHDPPRYTRIGSHRSSSDLESMCATSGLGDTPLYPDDISRGYKPDDQDINAWERLLRPCNLHVLLGEVLYPKLAEFLATNNSCPVCPELTIELDKAHDAVRGLEGKNSKITEDLKFWMDTATSAEKEKKKLKDDVHSAQSELLALQEEARQLRYENLRLLIKAGEAKKAQDILASLSLMARGNREELATLLGFKHALAERLMKDEEYDLASKLLDEVIKERSGSRDQKYRDAFKHSIQADRKIQPKKAERLLRTELLQNKLEEYWEFEVTALLASVCEELGNFEEARETQEKLWRMVGGTVELDRPETVTYALYLAALWRQKAERGGSAVDIQYYTDKSLDILREIRKAFDGSASRKPPDDVIRVMFKTGDRYFSQGKAGIQERNKWNVATEFLEWILESNSAALDPGERKRLLEGLDFIYRSRNYGEALKAEKVLTELYNVKSLTFDPADPVSIDRGHQLGILMSNSGQEDRLVEAATTMRVVFDATRKQCRDASKVTMKSLEILFFYARLLFRIARSQNKSTRLGEPEELYQTAAVAFRVVCEQGPRLLSFKPGDKSSFITKAGQHLLECLREQQIHLQSIAPVLSNVIWDTAHADEHRTSLGKVAGEVLVDIGTRPADEAAEHILGCLDGRIPSMQSDSCDINYGRILMRLGNFKKAQEILQRVKNRNGRGLPGTHKYAFDLASCLMTLGRDEDAREICVELQGSTDAGSAKWAAEALKRIERSTEERQKRAQAEKQATELNQALIRQQQQHQQQHQQQQQQQQDFLAAAAAARAREGPPQRPRKHRA
ncbi:hypothetical protein GQ53DRAFT_822558 [Thozetella sp. PMI_491]|nr:hypothetical protein GQ53DRAFT_822558 [Thozetella sp. PMI_491]